MKLRHLLQDPSWNNDLLQPGESVVHIDGGTWQAVAILKRLRHTPFNYLRITFGPSASMNTSDNRTQVISKLKETARRWNCVYLEFNPYLWDCNLDDWARDLANAGLNKTADHVYRNSFIVDLSQSEEEIFKQFDRRGQKALRQSVTRGIAIRKVGLNEATFDLMYELYCNTCSRTQFIPEEKSLLKKQLLYFAAKDRVFLFFAYYEENVVGGLVLFNNGDSVSTVYQGNDYTEDIINRRPSNALYWESLKWAKQNGFGIYDFGGVTVSDSYSDPKKEGIFNFKAQFGGKLVTLPGNFIYVNRPFIYRLVRMILPLYSRIALKRAKAKQYASRA